ncbi:uncharacterized protein LOC141898901 [Tubulanus polymorphus]|uniref:uncharacterized protein LOC141898901 n=1 Tax=Tubulanus polymorphus TaxID=672921 RepID=UPI003DA49E3D
MASFGLPDETPSFEEYLHLMASLQSHNSHPQIPEGLGHMAGQFAHDPFENLRGLPRPAGPSVDDLRCEAYRLKEHGNALFKEGNYAKALDNYNEAFGIVNVLPRCDEFRNLTALLLSNRAYVFNRLGLNENAIKDIELCINLDPSWIKASVRQPAIRAFIARICDSTQNSYLDVQGGL